MSEDRQIVTVTFDWQGVALSVDYEANWLEIERSLDRRVAHLAIRAVQEGTKLPITDTGYRSHFAHPDTIEAAGGPQAFVIAWLDAEAATEEWQSYLQAERQWQLF